MKPEDMSKKCPECSCQDKRISRKRAKDIDQDTADAYYIPHIPQGDVGVIRCSQCGHIFEYCTERKPPLEVKKILV